MRERTLEEMIEFYGGKENLVPIAFLKQQILYAKFGVQPKFIWEKEGQPGKIVAWYSVADTKEVIKEWRKTKPENN